MSDFFKSESRNEKFDIEGSKSVDARIKRAQLVKEKISSWTAVRSELENFNGVSSELHAAKFLDCKFVDSNFMDVTFTDCVLDGVLFEACVFRMVRFERCVLNGVVFEAMPEGLESGIVLKDCVLKNAEALEKNPALTLEDCVFLVEESKAQPKAKPKERGEEPRKPELAPPPKVGAPESKAEPEIRFGQLEIG